VLVKTIALFLKQPVSTTPSGIAPAGSELLAPWRALHVDQVVRPRRKRSDLPSLPL